MPAQLVPPGEIPKLAEHVDAPMLKVLRCIEQAGFVLNDAGVGPETATSLKRLTELRLVDPGYVGASEQPFQWVSNANGARVLRYLSSIPQGPHYEITASELAAWLIEQGKDRWWNVDGDPLLTGRLTFPCPAERLAAEFNQIDRPLLVQAKKSDTGAKGQTVGKAKLNELVAHTCESHAVDSAEIAPWRADRMLYLRWKGASDEWLLIEDSETTEQMRAEALSKDNGKS